MIRACVQAKFQPPGWLTLCTLMLAATGCSKTDPEPPGGSTQRVEQRLEHNVVSFAVTLPVGVSPSAIALGAAGSLRVNDRAEVTGPVINTGSDLVTIGVDARTMDVRTTTSGVLLRDRARVVGDVFSAGTLTTGPGVVVQGEVLENEPAPTLVRTFAVEFGEGERGAVAVEPGQDKAIEAGSYVSITVKNQGMLRLHAGEGGIRTLQFTAEPGSQIILDTENGPIGLMVRDTLSLRGTFLSPAGSDPAFLIGYHGTATVHVENSFMGAILAPNAKINVQGGGTFSGQAIGKDIELHQDLLWNGQANYVLDELFDPVPDAREPETSGEDSLEDLLPSNEVGAAVRAYFDAGFASTDPAALAQAVLQLRSLPPADVVGALSNAFDNTNAIVARWGLIRAAVELNDPAALPLFAGLLQAPVPALNMTHSHDPRVEDASVVLAAAVSGLARLTDAGSAAARSMLIDAATNHALVTVRANAIMAAVSLDDAALMAELDPSIRPEDREFLSTRPFTDEEAAFPPDPVTDTGVEDDLSLPGGSAESGDLGGGGGTDACDENTAIDLGSPGNDVTVSTNACLRVRDGYPSWWQIRTMKLETTLGDSYPIAFFWSNSCSGSGGTGLLEGDWHSQLLNSTSSACPTLVSLQGTAGGQVTLRYWSE